MPTYVHLTWESSYHIWCTSTVVSFMDPLIISSNPMIMRSSCHTSCTWIASFQCHSFHASWCGKAPEISMVFPSWILWWYFLSILILRSSCHTFCNWMAFLQCDSLHESSPDVEKLLWHLVYFNGCFQWNLRSDGTSSLFIMKISCHTICTWMASLQCDSLHKSSPALGCSAKITTAK